MQNLRTHAFTGLLFIVAVAAACEVENDPDSDETGGAAGEGSGATPGTGGTSSAGDTGSPGGVAGAGETATGGSGDGGSDGTTLGGAGGSDEGGELGGSAGEGGAREGEGGAPEGGSAGQGGAGTVGPEACTRASPSWTGAWTDGGEIITATWDVTASPCGDVIVGAYTGQAGVDRSAAIQQIQPNGDPGWLVDIESEGGAGLAPIGLVTDSAGNVYFAGHTNETPPRSVRIGAYARGGAPRWGHLLEGERVLATAISRDGSGNVYVSGESDTPLPDELPNGSGSGFVVKLDFEGTHVWTARLNPGVVAADSAGNAYVLGSAPGGSVELVKLDPAGAAVWTVPVEIPEQRANAFDTIAPTAVAVSDDGEAIYVATSVTDSECPRQCRYPALFVRFDADGGLVESFFPEDEVGLEMELADFATNDDGSRLFTLGFGSFLARYDGVDERVWSYVPADLRHYYDRVTLDASGDLILSGSGPVPGSEPSENLSSWQLIRLSADDASAY